MCEPTDAITITGNENYLVAHRRQESARIILQIGFVVSDCNSQRFMRFTVRKVSGNGLTPTGLPLLPSRVGVVSLLPGG